MSDETNKVNLDIGYAVTLDDVPQPQVKATDAVGGRTFVTRVELSKLLKVAGPYEAFTVPSGAKVLAMRYDRDVKIKLADGAGTIEVTARVGPTPANGKGMMILPATGIVSFEAKDADADEDVNVDFLAVA